jgi:hypothetical protein
MTYDKIKSLEASILDAIKKHDCDAKELTKFAEDCFVSHRVRNVNENQIKNYVRLNNALEREIARHKACIGNLRGYISFLEEENEKLQQQIDQE